MGDLFWFEKCLASRCALIGYTEARKMATPAVRLGVRKERGVSFSFPNSGVAERGPYERGVKTEPGGVNETPAISMRRRSANRRAIAPSVQTGRLGMLGPVRRVLGCVTSPAIFYRTNHRGMEDTASARVRRRSSRYAP